MQVFVLALELEHAALELDLLRVEGGELRGELLARLSVDRLETLALLALAASLRRLRAPPGGRLADVRGEDGDEGGLLRELVELHNVHDLAKDDTLSSKSHRMLRRYLVCSSSALYGVLAVGTRST